MREWPRKVEYDSIRYRLLYARYIAESQTVKLHYGQKDEDTGYKLRGNTMLSAERRVKHRTASVLSQE